MIQQRKILDQLHSKRDRFRSYDDDFHREAHCYREALRQLSTLSGDEIQLRLAAHSTPGALPTKEFNAAPNLHIQFPHRWNNHQEARAWAHEILLNRTTFAADGSQIQPTREFSIPIAAVQVAWFVNHHTADGRYHKEIDFELLAPDELLVEYQGEAQISEQAVNLRRFALEIETLCRLMKQFATKPETKPPLALFDSSLVISFADRLQEPQRTHYIELVLKLLRCSEETRVPLIGYVDASQSRDLAKLLQHCFDLPEALRIHDAQLLGDQFAWGDRTPVFVCARGGADKKIKGVMESYAEYRRGIGFVYLQTTGASPPARLDIPLWIFEQGLLEDVLDLVRAEVIVGNGYPYAIETADAAAVITSRDREAFYALFQKFAEEQKLELRLSQKAASKARRR